MTVPVMDSVRSGWPEILYTPVAVPSVYVAPPPVAGKVTAVYPEPFQ